MHAGGHYSAWQALLVVLSSGTSHSIYQKKSLNLWHKKKKKIEAYYDKLVVILQGSLSSSPVQQGGDVYLMPTRGK